MEPLREQPYQPKYDHSVRLDEYAPDRDADYPLLLQHEDMRNPDRDSLTRLEHISERAGSILVARSVDGTLVGGVQVSNGDSIGEISGLVVHPDYRGRGIGERLAHAAAATLRYRGYITKELLVDAPTEAPDPYPGCTLDAQPTTDTIEWWKGQGFKPAYKLIGMDTTIDALADCYKELRRLEVTPEAVKQAFQSAHSVHAQQYGMSSAMRKHDVERLNQVFAQLPNRKKPRPATPAGGEHNLSLSSTTTMSLFLDSTGELPNRIRDDAIEGNSHFWSHVPKKRKDGTDILHLVNSHNGRGVYLCEASEQNSSGYYVTYDKHTDRHEVLYVEKEDDAVRRAAPEEAYFVESCLVFDSWYLNLTPIQQHVYELLHTSAMIYGDDGTGELLKGLHLNRGTLSLVTGGNLYPSGHIPPPRPRRVYDTPPERRKSLRYKGKGN